MAGLAFRHPLVRLTCYEGLSAARRRLLHSAYAEAVLRRRPDAVDTLAAHLTRADDPRATGYLRQAAERAAALYANDTADRYYAELTGRSSTHWRPSPRGHGSTGAPCCAAWAASTRRPGCSPRRWRSWAGAGTRTAGSWRRRGSRS